MLIPAAYPATGVSRRVPRLLLPSLADCLFLAILLWCFAAGSGWSVLLADGDTGWHIRTGEYILSTHSVPTRDLFSFSKAGQPWFAWEWLSDVTFAALHHFWGLKGVVVFTGLVLSLAATLLFRYAVWRGSNVVAALVATLLATGASTVHYLARPHSRWWAGWSARFSRRSIGGTLRDCLHDFSAGPQRASIWVPVVLFGLSLIPWDGPRDFPANKFPVTAVERNLNVVAPVGSQPRILTSDQWGDYLIYHLYPKGRVFVDGRSDFYGSAVGRQYLDLLNASPNWEPEVTLGGLVLPLYDAQLVPGQVGVYQIKALVPGWAPTGMQVPLTISQGPASTTLTVRVIH